MSPPDNRSALQIERLTVVDSRTERELEALLTDSVASGASVGFIAPLDPAEGRTYWQDVFNGLAKGKKVLLVARRDGQLVGSVQLELAMKPKALHRAEVQKLMVLASARRNGIGQALMLAVEAHAREIGRTLLVLDTRGGDSADRLDRRMHYTLLGVVPGYAKSSSGVHHGTAFFYKHLA